MNFATLRTSIVIATVCLTSTTAEAAKGVKKGNGHHTVAGVVVSISPDKTGYGTFHLRTAQHHKKSNMGNNAGTHANNNQKIQLNQPFNVSSATMFQHHLGNSVTTVGPAALHKGQRVRVQFTGHQAEQVHIYTTQRTTPHPGTNFMRHRIPVYHAHIHHRRR